MRLILVGCEYSGTTTLANAIMRWAEGAMGGRFGFHDHWKIPIISHDPMTDEEIQQFLALSPSLKEMFQRYHMDYHLQPAFYANNDHKMVGFHIEEAVYAPLYYGYGGEGEYADRRAMARSLEARIMEIAPDTVLVLVKASPEVIARRMKENPHPHGLVQEKDIEHVLGRFEEEYAASFISKKFTVDTSTATVEDTLAEFVENIEQHFTDIDRMRILTHQAMHKGG
jgi:hypothetical protein